MRPWGVRQVDIGSRLNPYQGLSDLTKGLEAQSNENAEGCGNEKWGVRMGLAQVLLSRIIRGPLPKPHIHSGKENRDLESFFLRRQPRKGFVSSACTLPPAIPTGHRSYLPVQPRTSTATPDATKAAASRGVESPFSPPSFLFCASRRGFSSLEHRLPPPLCHCRCKSRYHQNHRSPRDRRRPPLQLTATVSHCQ